METGVFVLGMHRSGTSAVTRLISLLGLRTPPEDDLVQATEKNPKGYWESESLVAFNERVLVAVDSDMRWPVALQRGWERDPRLDPLRQVAPEVVRRVYPTSPWVWKDPRHCLAFAFWHDALDVAPIVVLVNRNPLEIAASAQRVRSEQGKTYSLALWERYLREAIRQIEGLPVLVTTYDDVLSSPAAWCERTQAFLVSVGVTTDAPNESEVLTFVDSGLRHTASTRADFLDDRDVSDPQRALFAALEQLEGSHDIFVPPVLPAETPSTEAQMEDRRRAFQAKRDLAHSRDRERQSALLTRARTSRFVAPARRVYATGRRAASRFRSRLDRARDPRPPIHVLHVGKTGGTALNHALAEHGDAARFRLCLRGHDVTLADVPMGERFMFVVRDPLGRFVSAFNSRLREGGPRYRYPWREEERVAFAVFTTPDQLATALSSSDPAEREQAENAMRGIGHLNTPYSFWFGNETAFWARLADIFFIGFQERLDDDFDLLKAKLGLPPSAHLPYDETAAHRAPEGFHQSLSETARANLERWYERDLAFVRLCRELAPRVNAQQ